MRAKIIRIITIIMVLVLIFSVMAIDSDSPIPMITSAISLLWISLIAIANTEEEPPHSKG